MLKRNTTILLIIGLPFSFFAGLKCQRALSKVDEIGEPLLNTVTFTNDTLNDTVYLVTKRWGLTGDHQIFALTKTNPLDKHWQPNSSKDLIWKGENTIFYQLINDTIKIFTLQLPDKKEELETKQVVIVQQITGEEFSELNNQVLTSVNVLQ